MSGLAHVCIFRPLSPRENRLSFGTDEHKRTTRSPATESWAPPGILYSHLRRLWILRESPAEAISHGWASVASSSGQKTSQQCCRGLRSFEDPRAGEGTLCTPEHPLDSMAFIFVNKLGRGRKRGLSPSSHFSPA